MLNPKVFVDDSTGGLLLFSRLPVEEASALYDNLLSDVDPRSNLTERILYEMLRALLSDHYVNLYALSRAYGAPQHFAEAASELYIMLNISRHAATWNDDLA